MIKILLLLLYIVYSHVIKTIKVIKEDENEDELIKIQSNTTFTLIIRE